MADLAKTSGRLSTSITIKAIGADNKSYTIGAAVSFTEENTRPTTPRYELDGDKAGQIIERTPGLEDITLTLNRVVLYASDMLEAFGFDDAQSLIDQNVPFIVQKVESVPKDSGLSSRTTQWEGCWFHNMPKTYEMSGDLRVMQTVTIGATRKVHVK